MSYEYWTTRATEAGTCPSCGVKFQPGDVVRLSQLDGQAYLNALRSGRDVGWTLCDCVKCQPHIGPREPQP
jgi:hypothetical protein